MNFEAGFLSDNTYGVKHMNRVIRSLVTKGIVDYPFSENEGDIGSFNLNGFVQFLSEDGVIPETYKSMLVEKTDAGYILNPGMAFLDNGIYIFIESAQEFNCEPEQKVYWKHNTLTDKVEFICAAEYPAIGSYLPLAEILADGNVKNVRKCARAKLPGMASDYERAKKISVNETFVFDQKIPNGFTNGYYTTKEYDLGGNNFKHLLFVVPGKLSADWAIIDLETGACRYTYTTDSKEVESVDCIVTIGSKQGDGFTLSVKHSNTYSFYEMDYYIQSISQEGKLTIRAEYYKASGPTSSWDIVFDMYVF